MTRIQRQIEGKKPRTPLGSALAGPLVVLMSTLGLSLVTLASCAGEAPPQTATALEANTKKTNPKLDITWLPPVLRPWESAITQAATHHGVDPDAVAIVTLVESAGDPNAKSPSGALGLMQLMPKTASVIAQELGIKDHAEERLLDPAYNLDLGASYFEQQLSAFGEQNPGRAIELAAAAYNGGPKIVREWLSGKATLSEETDRYRALVSGMWNERNTPRSATYDAWRARVRGKMAKRATSPLPGARKTLLFGEKTPDEGKPHGGIDLAMAPKTSVFAVLDGTVERVENVKNVGNGNVEPVLVIRHGGGLETRYRHIEGVMKKPGDGVTRGEVLGQVGESAGGPHLHFEVLDQGEPIDPMPYLVE